MSDWKPLHILLRSDPIANIPVELKEREYVLFDQRDGVDILSEYDDCVFHAYAICAKNGMSCENIIAVREMPKAALSKFMITKEFDAIFFIDNIKSKETLELVHRSLEDMDLVSDRIKMALFEIMTLSAGRLAYECEQLRSFLEEIYEKAEGVQESFSGVTEICSRYLRPNILQYLNSTKSSS